MLHDELVSTMNCCTCCMSGSLSHCMRVGLWKACWVPTPQENCRLSGGRVRLKWVPPGTPKKPFQTL